MSSALRLGLEGVGGPSCTGSTWNLDAYKLDEEPTGTLRVKLGKECSGYGLPHDSA